MLGKYSPTTSHSYAINQKWFESEHTEGGYDYEGYDSYGYNKEGKDREGNTEWDYFHNEDLYNDVLDKYRNVYLRDRIIDKLDYDWKNAPGIVRGDIKL